MSGSDSDCRWRTQSVQEIGRKRAKILVKYDDALGRRAKVMIRKSQDRLHRHGIFSTSGPDRPSLAKALSTLVEYSRFRNRFGSVGTGVSRRFPASAARWLS
jgi:tRNA (Thr-GGU) A37 N-methylase